MDSTASVESVVRDEHGEIKDIIKGAEFSTLLHFEERKRQALAGREILYLLRRLPEMGLPDPFAKVFRAMLAGMLVSPSANVLTDPVNASSHEEAVKAQEIFEEQCLQAERDGQLYAERILQEWIAGILIETVRKGY